MEANHLQAVISLHVGTSLTVVMDIQCEDSTLGNPLHAGKRIGNLMDAHQFHCHAMAKSLGMFLPY